VLCLPPLKEGVRLAIQNAAELDQDRSLQGRSLADLRRWARDCCLRAAEQYTVQLSRQSPDQRSTTEARRAETPTPLFVAGHQPLLFHPGVWVKNFAVDRLAALSGGCALHLIVDNDTLTTPGIRVPIGSRAAPGTAVMAFDARRPPQPWEEAQLIDPEQFASFGARVTEAMRVWGVTPLLSRVWPEAIRHATSSTSLVDCLAAARHGQERRWGLRNLELPISRMCATEPFLWFAAHLLAEHLTFAAIHNQVLGEFRQLNRVRSRNHPVPELVRRGEWTEAPLWVWREGDLVRRPLFVRPDHRTLVLSDGHREFARLRLVPGGDACCAVEDLQQLLRQGIRLRTRALTTTLFARLCLGDLFVHGIGGAMYDSLTDQLIARFYGLRPPAFLTISATVHLPIGPPYPCTADDERRLMHQLRDLRFNAERHGAAPASGPLLAEKQRLLEERRAQPRGNLTQRERRAQRPANRVRHRRLQTLAAALARLAEDQHIALEQELARVRHELAANRVLQDREYAALLFPEELLQEFLQSAVGGPASGRRATREPVPGEPAPGEPASGERWPVPRDVSGP
jgi:hypothetical protein